MVNLSLWPELVVIAVHVVSYHHEWFRKKNVAVPPAEDAPETSVADLLSSAFHSVSSVTEQTETIPDVPVICDDTLHRQTMYSVLNKICNILEQSIIIRDELQMEGFMDFILYIFKSTLRDPNNMLGKTFKFCTVLESLAESTFCGYSSHWFFSSQRCHNKC